MREKVIRSFIDKETKKPYNSGSFYESDDESRINELKEKGFLHKEPDENIESKEGEAEDKYPIHKGGGYYELSNGEKIQGKEEAIDAEKKLGD